MSTKTRAARPSKKAEGKKEAKKVEQKEERRPQVKMPTGRTPFAVISSRHEGSMVQRHGRGFSIAELREAELPMPLARRWGVQVDALRRTSLNNNVGALKGWYTPQKPATSPVQPVESVKPAHKKPRSKKANAD